MGFLARTGKHHHRHRMPGFRHPFLLLLPIHTGPRLLSAFSRDRALARASACTRASKLSAVSRPAGVVVRPGTFLPHVGQPGPLSRCIPQNTHSAIPQSYTYPPYGLRHLNPRTANTTTHRAAKPSPIIAPHRIQITPARATPYTAHSVRFHAFCLHHGFTRTR